MPFASQSDRFPIRFPDGTRHDGTVFLAAIADHPRLTVGRYSYFSSHVPFDDPKECVARLAPYLYPASHEALIIGSFCQIAHGVQFITSSANHRYDGLTSYPFAIFDDAPGMMERPSMPQGGRDTVVGHDVWLGTGALILPGARIGNGVIVGAGAVVAGEVPDYTIVGGNPAQIIRQRLSSAEAARMAQIAWWDWPIDLILTHEALLCGKDIDALEAVALEINAPRR